MTAVANRNIKFLSHTDQGGRGDGVQVMINRGYAYIGHGFSNGITIVDVRDAKHPKPVNFLSCPPNTRAHHLQTHGDLLLAVNGPSVWTMQVSQEAYFAGSSAAVLEGQKFTGGLRVYDLARGDAPREIAFLPLGGLGPHRIWYVGGRYTYVSVHLPEFSDHVLVIVDMAEPAKPEVVGKFWLPGMWTAGGETPNWPKGKRYALHHALVAGDLAYSAWRDGGLAVVNVGDPKKPAMLAHCNWDPPFGGGTHSPLPLPDRNLLVVADEANFADCKLGLRYIWIFDVREPSNPISIATMPIPDEADYCKKAAISARITCGRTGRERFKVPASFSPRCTMPACALTTSPIRLRRVKSVFSCRPTPSACTIHGRTSPRSFNPATVSSTHRA
jgi:hypothetical protein